MNQDEIIEMARQVGFSIYGDSVYTDRRFGYCKLELEAFAKLVAAKAVDDYLAQEREAEWKARGEA